MKKWKPMFRIFFQGHGPESSHQGRWRDTMDSGGVKIKISKWGFHHEFSWSRDFQIYLQIWDRMSRNQDNVICWYWSTTKLEVEESQLVEPKISKWIFSHVFPLYHRTLNVLWNQILMSTTHFISFRRSAICQWPRKVKSHKKIARKLELLKTF